MVRFNDVRVPVGLMLFCGAVIFFAGAKDAQQPMMVPLAAATAPTVPAPPSQVTAHGRATDTTPGASPTDGPRSIMARAQAGDARAAFHSYEHARRCETETLLFQRTGKTLSSDCEDYVPVKSAKDWYAAALAGGDPLAKLHDAVAAHLTTNAPPEALDGAIADAIASRDPEVLTALGWHLLNPEVHPDHVDGLAWLLVACGDCTTDDPRIGFGCAAIGACAYGGTLEAYLETIFPDDMDEAETRASALRQMYRL
jgi:hypothetical protein